MVDIQLNQPAMATSITSRPRGTIRMASSTTWPRPLSTPLHPHWDRPTVMCMCLPACDGHQLTLAQCSHPDCPRPPDPSAQQAQHGEDDQAAQVQSKASSPGGRGRGTTHVEHQSSAGQIVAKLRLQPETRLRR